MWLLSSLVYTERIGEISEEKMKMREYDKMDMHCVCVVAVCGVWSFELGVLNSTVADANSTLH